MSNIWLYVVNIYQMSKLDTWQMLKMSHSGQMNLIPHYGDVDTLVRSDRAFRLSVRASHDVAMFWRLNSHLSGKNPSRRLMVLAGMCTLSGPFLGRWCPCFWTYFSAIISHPSQSKVRDSLVSLREHEPYRGFEFKVWSYLGWLGVLAFALFDWTSWLLFFFAATTLIT